jgi:multidrug efflux pump
VQAAINAASNLLPADLPNPPIYSKVNPADAPILTLALTSTRCRCRRSRTSPTPPGAEDLAAPGVGLVSISGGQKPAVRIQANPTRSPPTAEPGGRAHRARAANVNQAKGSFDGPRSPTDRRQRSALTSADYKPLVIAYRNGAPVRSPTSPTSSTASRTSSRPRG